jgi:hypothetical protein
MNFRFWTFPAELSEVEILRKGIFPSPEFPAVFTSCAGGTKEVRRKNNLAKPEQKIFLLYN